MPQNFEVMVYVLSFRTTDNKGNNDGYCKPELIALVRCIYAQRCSHEFASMQLLQNAKHSSPHSHVIRNEHTLQRDSFL